MERWIQTVLLSLLCFASFLSLDAKDTKPLRLDLAERQRTSGYALIDGWGSRSEVYVVSVEHRTMTKTKAKNIQDLTSTECLSRERRYSVFYRKDSGYGTISRGQTEKIEPEGDFSTQCFSPELKFVYFADGRIRIYDVKLKKSTDISEERDRTGQHGLRTENGRVSTMATATRYAT
jgi:hypothetical protein